jgi:glycosyltransferase involved in cell wall biosynthesis
VSSSIRVAVFQGRVPRYRTGVFARLAKEPDLSVSLYAAAFDEPIPNVDCHELDEMRLGALRVHPELLSSEVRQRHDVIVVEGRLSLVASLLHVEGCARGVPCVWWTSLWREDGTIGAQPGVLGLVTRRALRRASAVVTYSRTAAAAAIAAGANRGRVFIAPNSLDTPTLQAAETAWKASTEALARHLREHGVVTNRVALFLGRLIRDKRLDVLVDAWEKVVARHGRDSPLLIVIGDGDERAPMTARARALGVLDRIRFLGSIHDSSAVCPFVLAARALVLPGSGGLAVNQAMTHGLPPIVAGGDGTEQDVIENGQNGYIVQQGNAGELADKLDEVLYCSDEQWCNLSIGARRAIQDRANLDLMIGGLTAGIRCAAGRGDNHGAGIGTAARVAMSRGCL